jgi:hypothetical protein
LGVHAPTVTEVVGVFVPFSLRRFNHVALFICNAALHINFNQEWIALVQNYMRR